MHKESKETEHIGEWVTVANVTAAVFVDSLLAGRLNCLLAGCRVSWIGMLGRHAAAAAGDIVRGSQKRRRDARPVTHSLAADRVSVRVQPFDHSQI